MFATRTSNLPMSTAACCSAYPAVLLNSSCACIHFRIRDSAGPDGFGA